MALSGHCNPRWIPKQEGSVVACFNVNDRDAPRKVQGVWWKPSVAKNEDLRLRHRMIG